jgi:hypothetical protein
MPAEGAASEGAASAGAASAGAGAPGAPPAPDAGSTAAPGVVPGATATAQCANCGALLAADQRYCLECGERRVPMSSFLLAATGAQHSAGAQPAAPPPASPPVPPVATAGSASGRSGTLNTIAFIGVLLLAMGVGVLIGRAGKSKPAPAPVVTVNAGSPTDASTGSTEAPFTSSWPSGTSGYTVQLQTLPASGTSVSAVEAARTSATAKGAPGVGALKSEEFSSLPSGNYVIYSGVYKTRAQAQKALPSVRKSFPGASVIHVSGGSASAGSGSPGGESTSSGESGGAGGGTLSKPVKLKHPGNSHGKKYEEESKNLPDVVETG